MSSAGIQGMASLVAPIIISFIPILRDISTCLGFPEPIYSIVNIAENLACVIVLKQTHPDSYIFHGDKGVTLKDSYESAAEKMVLFLVRKYKILVVDANLERRRNLEQGVQLFKMKRRVLDALEKKMPALRTKPLDPIKGVDYSSYTVKVDFMSILQTIINKTQARITPMELQHLNETQYTAWITLATPDNNMSCIAGELASTVEDAKQSLAQKVVIQLMQIYCVDVMDVNYFFLNAPRLALKRERENYLALKEKIYGLPEDRSPRPFLIEQDQLTPHGRHNIHRSRNIPHLAPEKTKIAGLKRPLSITITENLQLPEIKTSSKITKRE